MNYEDIPAVRYSNLKGMAEDPAKVQHLESLVQDEAGSKSYLVGGAAHCGALEGRETFHDRYALCDVRRDKRTEKYKQWLADNAGKLALSVAEWDQVMGIISAVEGCEKAQRFLRSMREFECAITWADPDHLVPCKGRIDAWGDRLIDMKTTAKPPSDFYWAMKRYHYVVQLAWYEDGLRHNGKEMKQDPCFLVAESVPPHRVVVYEIPRTWIDAARYTYKGWLKQYAECEDMATWPAYGEGFVRMEEDVPLWLQPAMDDILINVEVA